MCKISIFNYIKKIEIYNMYCYCNYFMSFEKNVAEIYVLGIPSNRYNKLSKTIYQQHDPTKVDHVLQFIDFMTNTSMKNKTFPIFLICAHGDVIDGEYTLEIIGDHKLRLKSSLISNKLKECKQRGLKCFGMIEACYSGNFDTSGFEMAITASDSKHMANHGILQESVDSLLQKSMLTPSQVHYFATNEKSRIVESRSAWSSTEPFTAQLFGSNYDYNILHPFSLIEISKIKTKGNAEDFSRILNENKTTNGDYTPEQVYSLLYILYGNPIC